MGTSKTLAEMKTKEAMEFLLKVIIKDKNKS